MIAIKHNEILSGSAVEVKIEGPLNGKTGPDFENYIHGLFERNISYILFDMKDLDYISSEGIGVILLIQQRIAEKNGFLVMFNLSEELSAFFVLLGFDKLFTIGKTRIDAIQIMDRQFEMRAGGHEQNETHATEEDSIALSIDSQELELAVETDDDVENQESVLGDGDVTQQDRSEESMLAGTTSEITSMPDNEQNEKGDNTSYSAMPHSTTHTQAHTEERNVTHNNEQITSGSLSSQIFSNRAIENERTFSTPLIVECKKCKALIRIKSPGEYLCPDCRVVFTAKSDQTIFFNYKE